MSYIGNKPADTIATSADISDGAITAAKLATSSVTQPKINGGVAGTGPAFSAGLVSSQTVSNSTFTKVQLTSEEFDTASCYDNSTNYRFTPTVAGYYQVNGSLNITSSTNSEVLCVVYKNGAAIKWGNYLTRTALVNDASSVVSALIYLNGSTDYIELFGYINGTGTLQFIGPATRTYFQASMVRAV